VRLSAASGQAPTELDQTWIWIWSMTSDGYTAESYLSHAHTLRKRGGLYCLCLLLSASGQYLNLCLATFLRMLLLSLHVVRKDAELYPEVYSVVGTPQLIFSCFRLWRGG
jgi:hypothetical protein